MKRVCFALCHCTRRVVDSGLPHAANGLAGVVIGRTGMRLSAELACTDGSCYVGDYAAEARGRSAGDRSGRDRQLSGQRRPGRSPGCVAQSPSPRSSISLGGDAGSGDGSPVTHGDLSVLHDPGSPRLFRGQPAQHRALTGRTGRRVARPRVGYRSSVRDPLGAVLAADVRPVLVGPGGSDGDGLSA